MNERMNEWMNGMNEMKWNEMKEWMHEWMNEWMNELKGQERKGNEMKWNIM